MKFGVAYLHVLVHFSSLPWTGLKNCHVLVPLPGGFLADFLKLCVALEHLCDVGMDRRMLAMSPTTFPNLRSLQFGLKRRMTQFGPPLPLTIHLEILRFPLTHLSIQDEGNYGPFGTSSFTDLLITLQAPPTLHTIALTKFAPRRELLTFLSRHFDQFTNVAVGLDLLGDYRTVNAENTRSFCLPSILWFIQGGVVPEICFRGDMPEADTELSLSYSALLEGFSYVRDPQVLNGGPAQIQALGLVCFGADLERLPPTLDVSVPVLFNELLRSCQSFTEVRELNIQLSCMDLDMQDPQALQSIVVSFASICFNITIDLLLGRLCCHLTDIQNADRVRNGLVAWLSFRTRVGLGQL